MQKWLQYITSGWIDDTVGVVGIAVVDEITEGSGAADGEDDSWKEKKKIGDWNFDKNLNSWNRSSWRLHNESIIHLITNHTGTILIRFLITNHIDSV